VNLHDELDVKRLNPDKKGDQEKVLKQFFFKNWGRGLKIIIFDL